MKKLLTILVLIMLIISFFQITRMYALYKEQLQSDYSSLLGVWSIKVNGTDVSSGGQNLGFNITDDQLQYIASDYIQAGKIAPSGQAYFDIIIDPTNTDVSIIYQIDLKSDDISNVNIELFNVENYFQQDGQTEQTTNLTFLKEGNMYKSVIPVDVINAGNKNYIRLYFKWINLDEKDATDSTLAGTEDAKLSIPIQINLRQYTGEAIGNGS